MYRIFEVPGLHLLRKRLAMWLAQLLPLRSASLQRDGGAETSGAGRCCRHLGRVCGWYEFGGENLVSCIINKKELKNSHLLAFPKKYLKTYLRKDLKGNSGIKFGFNVFGKMNEFFKFCYNKSGMEVQYL